MMNAFDDVQESLTTSKCFRSIFGDSFKNRFHDYQCYADFRSLLKRTYPTDRIKDLGQSTRLAFSFPGVLYTTVLFA